MDTRSPINPNIIRPVVIQCQKATNRSILRHWFVAAVAVGHHNTYLMRTGITIRTFRSGTLPKAIHVDCHKGAEQKAVILAVEERSSNFGA
jgi:hypothetical protein